MKCKDCELEIELRPISEGSSTYRYYANKAQDSWHCGASQLQPVKGHEPDVENEMTEVMMEKERLIEKSPVPEVTRHYLDALENMKNPAQ